MWLQLFMMLSLTVPDHLYRNCYCHIAIAIAIAVAGTCCCCRCCCCCCCCLCCRQMQLHVTCSLLATRSNFPAALALKLIAPHFMVFVAGPILIDFTVRKHLSIGHPIRIGNCSLQLMQLQLESPTRSALLLISCHRLTLFLPWPLNLANFRVVDWFSGLAWHYFRWNQEERVCSRTIIRRGIEFRQFKTPSYKYLRRVATLLI